MMIFSPIRHGSAVRWMLLYPGMLLSPRRASLLLDLTLVEFHDLLMISEILQETWQTTFTRHAER